MRVVQEQTWGGRLFQTVGAAMRKAREPNDKLDSAEYTREIKMHTDNLNSYITLKLLT